MPLHSTKQTEKLKRKSNQRKKSLNGKGFFLCFFFLIIRRCMCMYLGCVKKCSHHRDPSATCTTIRSQNFQSRITIATLALWPRLLCREPCTADVQTIRNVFLTATRSKTFDRAGAIGNNSQPATDQMEQHNARRGRRTLKTYLPIPSLPLKTAPNHRCLVPS